MNKKKMDSYNNDPTPATETQRKRREAETVAETRRHYAREVLRVILLAIACYIFVAVMFRIATTGG